MLHLLWCCGRNVFDLNFFSRSCPISHYLGASGKGRPLVWSDGCFSSNSALRLSLGTSLQWREILTTTNNTEVDINDSIFKLSSAKMKGTWHCIWMSPSEVTLVILFPFLVWTYPILFLVCASHKSVPLCYTSWQKALFSGLKSVPLILARWKQKISASCSWCWRGHWCLINSSWLEQLAMNSFKVLFPIGLIN